jgi:Cys-tRNA(Pro) deacylase
MMDLEKYLAENKVWHRFIEKAETVHTADAAAAAGFDLNKVTKSLILLDQDKNCILAIIPGNCKLSFEKLKKVLNVKRIYLVPFEKAEEFSGYPPGATPMIFHKVSMKVLVDSKLAAYEAISGGGGTRTRLLELRTEDVIKLNSALVADITEQD